MSSASRAPMITYCVPAHEVQPLPDFEEENYLCPQLVFPSAYPSASAEYSLPSTASAGFSYPTDDPDFCDIIADLAQGECYDFSWGPSAVALPVDECDGHGTVAAVSISLPEGYATPYDAKGIQIVHASAVKALEDHDSDEEMGKLKSMEYEEFEGFHGSEDMAVMKKKKIDNQKMRRQHAVLRLKEKRKLKKYKLVAKSGEVAAPSRLTSSALPVNMKPDALASASAHAPAPVATTITARQAAAAHRERVKGKFKHNKTRWVAVTEFLHRTHLHSADGDGGGDGSGGAGGWDHGNT